MTATEIINSNICLPIQAKGKKPLFVQFVLENLWAVYDAVLANRFVKNATNNTSFFLM